MIGCQSLMHRSANRSDPRTWWSFRMSSSTCRTSAWKHVRLFDRQFKALFAWRMLRRPQHPYSRDGRILLASRCRVGPCLLDLGHAAGQAVEHALVLSHAVQAVPRHALAQALQQRRDAPLHWQQF